MSQRSSFHVPRRCPPVLSWALLAVFGVSCTSGPNVPGAAVDEEELPEGSRCPLGMWQVEATYADGTCGLVGVTFSRTYAVVHIQDGLGAAAPSGHTITIESVDQSDEASSACSARFVDYASQGGPEQTIQFLEAVVEHDATLRGTGMHVVGRDSAICWQRFSIVGRKE